MTSKNLLNYYYDQEADILYMSKGEPSKNDDSDEISDEVIARYDAKTKEIKGLTILNFAKKSKEKSRTVKLPFEIGFSQIQV